MAATSAATAAANTDVDVNGVSLGPVVVSSTTPGKVDFTWTVRTSKPVTFRYMQLATVGQAGTGFNPGVTVNGTKTFTASQSLPNGSTQTTRAVYQIGSGAWVQGPAVTYKVGSTAPVSTPAPSVPSTTETEDGGDTVDGAAQVTLDWNGTGLRQIGYNADGVAMAAPRISVDGSTVTYDWTMASNKAVTFEQLQLNVRDGQGTLIVAGQIPGTKLHGIGLNATTQDLPAGDYTARIAYKLAGGGWVESTATSFTVASTRVPPLTTPAPAPEPVGYDSNGVAIAAPAATVAADGTVTFAWDVRTNKSLTFTHLQLATSGQPGAGFNNGVAINGTRSFTATQKFAPGTYQTGVVYHLNGAWVNGPRTTFTVGAPNNTTPAPTPAPTPVNPPATTPPSTSEGTTSANPMPLPSKVVGGFWMKWSNSRSVRLANVDQRYNVIYLAFAQGSSGTGALHFNQSAQPQAQFKQDVATVRARGQRVIMSIGGEGGRVDLSTQQRRQQLLDSLIRMRENEVVFDGIDWDIEQAVIDADGMYWVSKQLKQRYGKNFAITAAPQGHRVEYKVFAQRMGDDLDFFGIQFYDYSEPSQASRINAVKYRTNELITRYGVDPSRIGIGFRVQDYSERYVSDSGASNWWSINGSKQAWNELEAQYPTMRGAYLWELSMDNRAGGRWIKEVGPVIAN